MNLEDYVTTGLIRGLRLYARRFAYAREDAYDIVQNALLKASLYFGRYNPKYKFTTWIYQLVTNEAHNMRFEVQGILGAKGHHPADETKFLQPIFIDHPIRNEKTSKLEWFDLATTHPENGYIEAIDAH